MPLKLLAALNESFTNIVVPGGTASWPGAGTVEEETPNPSDERR